MAFNDAASSHDNDRLMTTSELADYLAIPLQSLYMLRHRKQGPPAIRLGSNTLRFRKSDVDEWLAQHVELA